MLNYIWAGLIILSIGFALVQDIQDEWDNRFNNETEYLVPYSLDQDNIQFKFNNQSLHGIQKGKQIQIPLDQPLPSDWHGRAQYQRKNKQKNLTAVILQQDKQHLRYTLKPLHWVKLKAIMTAAFDMAKYAVTLAIGLAGLMAMWLGLMQIAEKSGLMYYLVKAVQPLLRWLFPDIPEDHPALGSISLNLSANILGLGNAATPLGIKAMQQLQELNQNKQQASDAMCMFLALNTSSVQLLPPVTLIAIMGVQVSELMLPIIIATFASTFVAIVAAKFYRHRRNV